MSIKKVTAGVLAATFLTLGGDAMLGGGATTAVAQIPAQTTPQEGQAPGGKGTENEAGENDTPTQPLTGQTLERATRAALAATGGGEVTAAHVGEEPGVAYDVDVALPDGREFDVHLDRNFNVIEVLDDATPDRAPPADQVLPDTGGVGVLPIAGVAGVAVLIAGGLIARRAMR